MRLDSLCQKLRTIIYYPIFNRKSIRRPLLFSIAASITLFYTLGVYFRVSASVAATEGVIINIAPSRTVIEEHEDLPVYIFITNNTNLPLTVNTIKPLVITNDEIPVNTQIAPYSTFETVVVVRNLPALTSNMAFAVYYQVNGQPEVQVIIKDAKIAVNYRFNFSWIPYTLSSLIGAVIGMFGTMLSRSLEHKKQIFQTNAENRKKALNKAISFYTWVEDAIKTSSSIPTLFWEKIFMDGDALLYLQEISETEPNQVNLSDISTDTISLLLLLNQLNDRIKNDDSHSTFTLNLIKKIDELALDLRNRVEKLM